MKLFIAMQLLLFSLFLFSHRRGDVRSNRILAIFLLFNALFFLSLSFLPAGLLVSSLIYLIRYGGFFLLGPLLYLYVQSMTEMAYHRYRYSVFHWVPATAFILFTLIRVLLHDPAIPLLAMSHGSAFFRIEFVVIRLLNYFHFFAYCAIIFRQLNLHEDSLKQSRSSMKKLKLSWINTISIGFGISYIFFFLHYLSHLKLSIIRIPVLLPLVLFLVLSNYLIIRVLKQTDIYDDRSRTLESTDVKKNKYDKSGLSEDELKSYQKKIKCTIETEKPYLNPLFTIRNLSELTGLSSHNISQVLNTELGVSFYQFINRYRIDESIRLMKDRLDSDIIILQIMHDAGFNSKSVFNTAFKRQTGKTPTQFLRQLKNR